MQMRFGLKKYPLTFKRAMEITFHSFKLWSALAYIADILVFLKNFNSHMARLGQITAVLEDAEVTFKPRKCLIFEKNTYYLCQVI